jgi:cell division protein YceG involved in septum cleavage
VLSLLDYTEQLFGPPADNLGVSQRLYLSSRLLLQQDLLKTPVDVLGIPQPFEIQLNESPLAVASRLEKQGLVHDAPALVNYLVYSGLDTSLQAGKYELSARMNALEIAHTLRCHPNSDFVIFPAGAGRDRR